MKLLFVLPEYGPDVRGGIATYYRHTFTGLLRAGCSIDVCVPSRDGSTGPLETGLGVRKIEAAPLSREQMAAQFPHLAAAPELWSLLGAAFGAWAACDRGRGYDVVEVTDWALQFVPWVLAADGPPVVVQLHGSSGQVNYHDPLEGYELSGVMTRLVETALLPRADELQSGGRENASEWSNLLRRPVHHIWPGWSPDSDAPSAAPTALGTEPFGVVVGRIQRWKGPEVLCEAARALGEEAPRLLWVGRDHPFRRLSRSMSAHLAERYPEVWGHAVRPVGEMSRADTASVQAAASFVVVPSSWDVFNYTVAEAMWAGKLVICSEGAGASELIEHGKNGFRFPTGDAQKLAELLSIARDLSETDRRSIGVSARATIDSELSVEGIAALRIEHFARLMAGPRGGSRQGRWLKTFFGPSEASPPNDFLQALPLKDILRHAARRSWRRFRSRWP